MKRNLLSIILGIVFLLSASPFVYAEAGKLPIISTTPGYTEFEPGKGAVVIDAGVTVSDEDSERASKAIVKLSNRPDGGNEFITIGPEVVDLAEDNGLVINYDFTKGELTIEGLASFALYQQILQQLNYNNVSMIPDIADRLVQFTVYDEEGNVSESKTRVIQIKNVQAVITNVEISDEGWYGIGEGLEISLIFNRPVFVAEGSPYFLVSIGGEEVKFLYNAGSGTTELKFTYAVEENKMDEDGIEVNPEVLLDGAVIKDSVGELADLSIGNFPDPSGIKVDGVRPYGLELTLPADGAYSVCDENTLKFSMTISEAVQLEGTGLVLNFMMDSGPRQATFIAEESNAELLVFTYTIAAGDAEADGVEIVGLTLGDLNILDQANNALTDLGLVRTEVKGENNITIDGTAPAAPTITAITPDSGANSTDGITNTNGLSIIGTAIGGVTIKVMINNEALGETTADAEGNWQLDISDLDLAEGNFTVTVSAVDESCNESAPSSEFKFQIDQTGPVLTAKIVEVALGEDGTVVVTPEMLIETVTDNFTSTNEIAFQLSKSDFACEDVGENKVALTATDLAGNATTIELMITVVSNEMPELIIEDLALELDVEGQIEIAYTDVVKGFAGGCYEMDDYNFTLSKSLFTCSDIGNQLVTLTSTAPNGEVTEYEVDVSVVDALAPVISGIEGNIDVYVGASGEYVLTDVIPEFEISDNCTVFNTSQIPASGTVLSGYNEPIEIKVQAEDASGNVQEAVFTITLKSQIIASLVEPEIITVSWGTGIEELPLPEQIEVVLLSGETVMLEVNWDMSGYDAMVPGMYSSVGELVLAGDLANVNQLQPSMVIMVLEKELPIDIELSDDEFSVEDNPEAPLGTLTTIDPDDDIHTYDLSGENSDEQYFYILGDRIFYTPENMPEGQSEFTISVTSTDRLGNTISKTFVITRTKPALDDLNIPNVFTPNGDGINDRWGVSALQFYEAVKVMVFERSGKMVFVTFDPTERWDGKYEGVDLPVGSYYFIIEIGSEGQKRRGVVTLIRD
ncbi:gliding motility-associated C-terminal domain-containing protein [Echinicola marina]|uniref:T9SS type B sorting domain-containing protein n=1 Tax=Echinicola marina TaxID=2859768 RepID=UPI001CF620E9|nr:gliding motility-associated C-terminal domain-containing protein [Echinicola marina]UCS95621.1 gliding motility-associated C-terminal domain-containing protein [Echinicola marina]